ncbi:helix-turn-helix domain-containing protein [Nonomuraea sp. NPDC050540]|uniref:helix-turn-helix domain-containing protein n=1 Tax=Nonomuraea sp. NPDC050540 TaxID=3364367 RepID=UPI00379D42D8
MIRVVALVHPPQAPFELACVTEVFGLRRPGMAARYDFGICALEPGQVPTLGGYTIGVGDGLEALESADTVVIPGWQADDVPGEIVDAVRRVHRRGARIVSICSAAFLVAEAGLLTGRRATTHWRRTEELALRYPDVTVDPDVLYVDHGDVATSAGTAAGLDLCLHIVRNDHGAAYATEIAQHMVMPPRREGGQAQFVRPAPVRERDGSLGAVLDWAAGRLDQPLTVGDLARRARLSPRTFARRFVADLGVSPGQWLLAQRVDAARELLERTPLPVETIAARVGLSSAVNLRRHFHARLGTTPAAYRRTFGG